jgi:DNA modification methylase
MEVTLEPTESVRPYEQNPRLNDDAVDAVANSLREFGFRQPIVVDTEHVIVCGHTRWKAARKLGLARVPVHVATDLTPDQIRAYRIADNQTATLSSWDYQILPIELSALRSADFDLSLLGFDADSLATMLAPAQANGLTDPDEVPAPPDEAITRPGDLWILGDHRLLCGDSSKPADLDRLLDGQPIHLVNMDPPYNVKVEPRSNNAIAAGLSTFGGATHHQSMDVARDPGKAKATGRKLRPKDRPLANDFVSDTEFDRLLDAWFGNAARVLQPGRGFYIWGGYVNCGNYPPFLKKHGLYFSQAIIWVKEHPVLTRKDFMGNHEWCFYGWREGAAHVFLGENNVRDVWTLSRATRGNVRLGNGVCVEGPDGSRLELRPPTGDAKVRNVSFEGDSVTVHGMTDATDVWSVRKVSPQAMVHLTEKPVELAARAMRLSSKPGESVLDLFGGSGSTLIGAELTGRRAYLMELDPLYCDVIVQRWERFTGGKAVRQASSVHVEQTLPRGASVASSCASQLLSPSPSRQQPHECP